MNLSPSRLTGVWVGSSEMSRGLICLLRLPLVSLSPVSVPPCLLFAGSLSWGAERACGQDHLELVPSCCIRQAVMEASERYLVKHRHLVEWLQALIQSPLLPKLICPSLPSPSTFPGEGASEACLCWEQGVS